MIRAVSLDFADTLYPHRPRELDTILSAVAGYLQAHVPPFEFAAMRAKFLEIRDRQFAENRATLRENDFDARLSEVTAFLNAAARVDPSVIAGATEAYADAFVAAMVAPPWLPEFIATLARSYRVAVLSNYPISAPIVRTLTRDGLMPHLSTVVVSADIGYIKPHASVFDAVLKGLGDPPPSAVVHVGDDWDADILGATRAGLHAVYTRQWRDTPDRLYGTDAVTPLAEIDDLRHLPGVLNR